MEQLPKGVKSASERVVHQTYTGGANTNMYDNKYKITLTKYRQIQNSTRLIKGTKTSTANLSSAHP